jgi:iron complex transport system ATP-binding protein
MLSVVGARYRLPDGRELFRDLAFELPPGEIVCILGPNGVGKSTLLRCLAGLDHLTAGTVRVDDRDLGALSRRDIGRRIGFVPQSDAPVFAFTVREMVEMGRAPHLAWLAAPGTSDRDIAAAALERLGISALGSRLYPELSGGERQLVLIARALAQRPRLLILDEPTSHLDFANAMRVLALVRGLAGDGLAVVMTSHDPDHAFLIAERTLLLTRDAPPQAGPTRTILTEARLSTTYGHPVRIVALGGRMLCFAETPPG